jgi:hypothetical protein
MRAKAEAPAQVSGGEEGWWGVVANADASEIARCGREERGRVAVLDGSTRERSRPAMGRATRLSALPKTEPGRAQLVERKGLGCLRVARGLTLLAGATNKVAIDGVMSAHSVGRATQRVVYAKRSTNACALTRREREWLWWWAEGGRGERGSG